MSDNFQEEEHTWGHAGPYTRAYATFGPDGYVGPITVTHPNGQSKVIIVTAVYAPEIGPTDQEVEAAVKATLEELGALPALVPWKTYLPYIAIAGIVVTGLVLWLRKK